MYLIYGIDNGIWDFRQFVSDFNIWDAGWYNGYVDALANRVEFTSLCNDDGQGIWAFFPLYPLVVSTLSSILGIEAANGVVLVGSILSSLFFCGAEFVAYKYILLTRDSEKKAQFFIAFMSLGIYSFYFSILYTEALFLLLLTLTFYFLRKEKYIEMGICGALLSATRSVGVMFVFVILTDCIVKYAKKEDKKSVVDFIKVHICNARLVLGTVLCPLGLFGYMFYLHQKLGDGFAFVRVQKGWGKVNAGLFAHLKQDLISNFPPNYLGVAAIIIIVLILCLYKDKHYQEAVYATIVLFMASTSSLVSLPRYMIGSLCVVLGFVDEYSKMGKRYRIILALVLFFAELVMIKHWGLKNWYLI